MIWTLQENMRTSNIIFYYITLTSQNIFTRTHGNFLSSPSQKKKDPSLAFQDSNIPATSSNLRHRCGEHSFYSSPLGPLIKIHPTAYMNTIIPGLLLPIWLNTTIERKSWWALSKRHTIEHLIGGR
jgi:hypothetical protein